MSDDFVPYLAGFRPGRVLAGYRLEALVGAGGMAVVFRARDERLDRPVALKILDPSRATDDPALRERFIAEWRAAAKVDDPHIIPVYDAAEADGVLLIAMRFVQGGDLRTVLEREGRLSPERAMSFISPVASALDAAHAAGLVHRDVKPANILVDKRAGRPEEVYLTDFGIAKAAASEPSLTQPGFLMGTPEYAAPEQIHGLPVDGRADQYGLACLAYELLTGTRPFEDGNVVAVLGAHLHTPPPSLSERRPDLPLAAAAVLAKAMAKVPGQRYESCGDFADALGEALGVAQIRPRRSAAAAPPPHPRAATLPSWAAMPETPPRPGRQPTVTDLRAAAGAAASRGLEPPVAPIVEPGEPDRRWQEPARRPAAPLTQPRRRGRAGRAARIGVPFAALAAAVALILVAVAMRTGTRGAVSDVGLSSAGCGSAFPGYPGQQGSVAVNSIASNGGTRLAAGSAGGNPAIWRCANGGWQLVSAVAVSALRGATLSSVAHGPAGWIAVGEIGSGDAQRPVAVTSANGVSWQPVESMTAFMGSGSCVAAAAAGPKGYAVVGNQMSGSRIFAAMWSSAKLQLWAQDNSDRGGFLDGRQLKSRVDAVAATPSGFVAVGTHGPGGVLWTSPDGQQWTLVDNTSSGVPSGALVLVAANGNRVVAAGYAAAAGGGDAPVVVVSTDGGAHWNPPVMLGLSGTQGRVTALAATGSGFTAAGKAGPAGAQRTVTWHSADGLTWSTANPVATGTSAVRALSAAGSSAGSSTGETVMAAPGQCQPA